MCRVLFLYATRHSGHQKAADAIQKSLQKAAPHAAIRSSDFFTCHYPLLGPVVFRMYLDLIHAVPHLWDYVYDNPDVAALTRELRRFFTFINIPKLRRLLRDFLPHIVVCTQALPAGFIAAEKKKGTITAPLVAVITDFVANPYWPDHHVDRYLVPDRTVKDQLISRGIAHHLITVTGIPIAPAFAQPPARAEACRKYGLRPDLPTILIMGGNHGLGQIPQAVRALAQITPAYQLAVVAGDNRQLYRQLAREYCTNPRIVVRGRLDSLARLMDCADLLVTKPGGLTSAEALAKGLPMILLAPLPGQEERNADYLVAHRAAERCRDVDDLPRMIESFFAHPAKLKRYRSQAFAAAHPAAADEAARSVLAYAP